MKPETAATIAARLLEGQLRDPWPADLAAAVRSIADSLASADAGPSAPEIRQALRALNRRRHFEHTKTISSAWHATRGCDPAIQKHHAQALIELGALGLAETLVNEAIAAAKGSADRRFAVELPEYRGLRGRIEKQRFVQSKDPNRLAAATDEYLAQYTAKRMYYHGINIVALRTEEERQGLPPRDGETTSQLAEEVLKIALAEHAKPGADQWPLATASEACLALHVMTAAPEWCDKAELWLHRFLNHPAIDPFSIESYSRQLREIWRADPLGSATCADRLAGILQKYVARTERRWSVDAGKVQEIRERPEVLEKNFTGEKSFTVANLKQMLELCPSIGCVIDSTGARLGTGFLMAGSSFGFEQPLVFVTNAHVISDTWQGSIASTDALVTFETESVAAGQPVTHAVDRVLFTSDPGDLGELSPALEKLDATIVSLKTLPANVSALKPAQNIPLPSAKSKAFVVGHPQSGALQFSLHDSVLLDVCDDERLMHYRTPTDPGSSGSPVFNANWQVVALHHAGSPETPRLHGRGSYEANEGIAIRAIRRKLGAA
jgi:V8-like Glu-specific endopeptidase